MSRVLWCMQGSSGGPTAIYTLSLPAHQTCSASETVVTAMTTQHSELLTTASLCDSTAPTTGVCLVMKEMFIVELSSH